MNKLMKISDNEAHSATYRSENEHFARRCRHYKSKDCKAEWLAEQTAFIDIDEFIVPIEKNSIYEILQPFEKNRGAVKLYWKMFGTSGLLERDLDTLVTEEFTVSWPKYYSVGSVILNGTDNILISMLLSVRDVGLASNYTLLMNSANSILGKIIDAFTASVGNLNTESNPKKQYDVFKKIMFISSWIYGFATIGIYLVSRDFIIAWIGEDYLLGTVVVTVSGWAGVIVKAVIVTIIFNALMVIIFFRTQMFKELVGSVKRVASRRA